MILSGPSSELGRSGLALVEAMLRGMGRFQGSDALLVDANRAAYALIAAGAIGVAVSIALALRKLDPKIAGIILITASIAPMGLCAGAFFGLSMGMGGIFAFLIKPPSLAAGSP